MVDMRRYEESSRIADEQEFGILPLSKVEDLIHSLNDIDDMHLWDISRHECPMCGGKDTYHKLGTNYHACGGCDNVWVP